MKDSTFLLGIKCLVQAIGEHAKATAARRSDFDERDFDCIVADLTNAYESEWRMEQTP